MSYSFKLLPKNIIIQISVLLCVFLMTYAGQKIGHHLLEQRQNYLHSLLENEQNKLELSYILQEKLLILNVKLHEMSNAGSQAEINHVVGLLQGLHNEIFEILEVVESGGEKKITYSVNFSNEVEMTKSLSYVNYTHQQIDLEIIELRAKLAELHEIVTEFKATVEHKIVVVQARDPLEIALVNRKVSNYFKGIEPFFSRILENSYRLHSTSQKETERIQKVNDTFNQTYVRIENTLATCVVAFILMLGWVILRSSRKIILERQNYQLELQDSNKNLENIVNQRTSALKKEICDRKDAEQQVKKHADFLHNIIESLAHPFYVIDADNYEIVLANSAAMESDNNGSTTCYELTHHRDKPCDCSDHPCPLQQVIETRAPVKVEHIHRNNKGEKIIVEVHGYPVFDANGHLIQMIEYSLDITAKKNAESALLHANDRLEETVMQRTKELEEQILQRKHAQLKLIKSERYYRLLIENVSDIITIIDGDGFITYSSPSTKKLLGISPEKIIGAYIGDLVLSDDLRHIDIPTLHQLHSGTTPMEYQIKDRTGKVHVLESLIQKFEQDDGTNAYILYSRDITVRKHSEDEAYKLRMVVEQSPSSIVITDTNGIIEYVNPAFEEITGYSVAEAVGLNPRVLKSGQTPEILFKQLWKTITAGKVWRGEFINKKKSGELYDENVLVIPTRNIKGEITHFVAVKENITELKKARKVAEKANQAKSNFLSHMSHELRTPLNAINGFSQLMLKSKKNPLNEKQKDMTGQIHSAGQHLLQLINEILDLARIESGEFTLAIEALDPRSFLDESLSLARSLADDKLIEITGAYEGKTLPSVRADLTRVKQVLLNLLSNAVKYNNPQGTVTIDVDMDIPGFLRFSIIDNGIGIPEEKQKDLFVPFKRALDNPNEIEGTGIGMTITKQLVEKMGGDIGFDSQVDHGSHFWFTLPVSVATVSVEICSDLSEQNSDKMIDTNAQEKQILYIEDNEANVRFMQDCFLEQEHFSLIHAPTGEDGVAMALENVPDLILMDLSLPGIDGFQAYRQLKADPKTEFVPIVAVSADAMEKTVKRVNRLGFSGYIPKPVDVDLLLKTMTDILET